MGDDADRVDAYIAAAPDYARPILERIRKAFHQGCPHVEEAIKWGVPHFMYKGMLGGMAVFKQHVSFGFWKSKIMEDPARLFGRGPKASMCNAHIASLKEMPAQKVLVAYVKEACRLNDAGVKPPRASQKRPPHLEVPADLAKQLKAHRRAQAAFKGMSPSHQREYVEWITEAKRDQTRQRRIATTIEWLTEGKSRNWKYEKAGE